MCFRPATVEQSQSCPGCGKKINAAMGKMPSKCPFCKMSFEGLEESGASAPAQAPAPGVPGAPKAPGAPAPK